MIIQPSFTAQITAWLSSLGYECKPEKEHSELFMRVEVRKECKFLLELKLIEIGLWNSDQASEELVRYAERQTLLRKSGVFSVTLWEDVWFYKASIVKSRLMALLGNSHKIPARLTIATRIDKTTAAEFLKRNHLQGSVSGKYRFGLYLPVKYFRVLPADYTITDPEKDLLVAVAVFSYPRIFWQNEKTVRSYELIHFASVLNTTIVGGLDKLLSAFIRQINPDDIMTYADREWSDGASYHRLGFEQISVKTPVTFYLNTETNERFTGKNHSEETSLLHIQNAGSIKFVKSIEKNLPAS